MDTHEPKPDFAVVISSFDGFSDVWPTFFNLWFRFSPNQTQPLYLITNTEKFADPRVISLPVGQDHSWSATLRRGLEAISHEYVLLSLEDFFVDRAIDWDLLQSLLQRMQMDGAAYLRLLANPPPDIPHPTDSRVGILAKGAAYRTSLQMALWKKSVLLELLHDDESAWLFEKQASRRSDHRAEAFLSVQHGIYPISYYPNTVIRGEWVRDAIRYFKPFGVPFDLSRRSREGWWSLVRRTFHSRLTARVKATLIVMCR